MDMNRLWRGLALSVSSAALLAPAAAIAQDAVYQFNIPAQDLSAALRAYGQQSGQQLGFDAAITRGKQSNSLQGGYSAEEGLRRLLEGTGLRFERTPAGVFVVRDPNAPSRVRDANGASPPTTNEEEITVTGTRIRGSAAIGSQTVTVTGDELRSRGYANLSDALRTVQQLGPAVSQNSAPVGGGVAVNFEGRTGVDLRGIGLGTTLVLINGQRPAASGQRGNFSDITNIPLSAIERVDILLDGASAVYGSDAIGGVINIILYRDYDGAESTVRVATYAGEATEYQFSHIFGLNWRGGNAFVGVQYDHRERLDASALAQSASSDKTPLGGDNFSVIGGNPGTLYDPNTFELLYGIPEGQDGTGLTFADLVAPHVVNTRAGADLLQESESEGIFFDITQDISSAATLQLHARYDRQPFARASETLNTFVYVPATNAFYSDIFGDGSDLFVQYDLSEDFDLSYSGVNEVVEVQPQIMVELGGGRQLRLDASFAEDSSDITFNSFDQTLLDMALASGDPSTAFNALGDGSNTDPDVLAAIATELHETHRSTVWGGGLTLDGPLIELPSGTLRFAIGAEYRSEAIETGTNDVNLPRTSPSREVTSAFAELAGRVLPQVEISLAGRYDSYSDFGSALVPRLGVQWRPVNNLALRASWGQSFRAPTLTDTDPVLFNRSSPVLRTNFPDPQAPTGRSVVLINTGVSPDLHEERADTWTLGLDFNPAHLPSFSITYSYIDYDGRIARPGPSNVFNFLQQEDVWAAVINRSPTQDEIDAICNSPTFFGTPAQCVATPPTVIIDARLRNLAVTRIEAIDFRASESIEHVFDGALELGLEGTYNIANERGVTADAPTSDIIDTLGNPLSWRVRATAAWRRDSVSIDGAINYTSGYDDPGGQSLQLSPDLTDPRQVDAWTTVDLGAEYSLPDLGVTFALRANNVFDAEPPFVNSASGFDGANANPYGRLVSLQVRKAW
jgi:iron complex outermembrane receptor protein